MKKISYILFMIIAIGCGGGDDGFEEAVIPHTNPDYNSGSSNDDDAEENTDNTNTPPESVGLIFPLNETECSNSDLTFEWNAALDSDGDTIIYNLIIDTSPNFNEDSQIYPDITGTNYTLDLPQSTALYWKIEASDGNDISTSETWSLYTQGLGVSNSAPQLEYIYPLDNAIINDQSPPLQWQATDNESTNENLVYKVYFSEVGQDLELIEEDTGISNLEVSGLGFGKSYQWAIYVSDQNGATNVGEVYTFSVQQ